MIQPAILYNDQLEKLYAQCWYDTKYQYYFSSGYRNRLDLSSVYTNPSSRREFVSVDNDGKLLAYISYFVDIEVELAYNFGFMSFPDSSIFIVAKDLYNVIDDIFCKYNLAVCEISCIEGNPVLSKYQKLVKKFNGRMVGYRTHRQKLLDGSIKGDYLFEVTRDQYLQYKNSRGET